MHTLQHERLSECGQCVLLEHVLYIGGHRQVILELLQDENLINDPQRQDALAYIH